MKTIPDHYVMEFTRFLKEDIYYTRIYVDSKQVGNTTRDYTRKNDGYSLHDIGHTVLDTFWGHSPVMSLMFNIENDQKWSHAEWDGCESMLQVEEGVVSEIIQEAVAKDYFRDDAPSDRLLDKITACGEIYWKKKFDRDLTQKMIETAGDIFGKLYQNNGGIVVVDRNAKTMTYQNNN